VRERPKLTVTEEYVGGTLPGGPICTTKLAGGVPKGISFSSVIVKDNVSTEPPRATALLGPLLNKLKAVMVGGTTSTSMTACAASNTHHGEYHRRHEHNH